MLSSKAKSCACSILLLWFHMMYSLHPKKDDRLIKQKGFSLGIFQSFHRRVLLCLYVMAMPATWQLWLLTRKSTYVWKIPPVSHDQPVLQRTHTHKYRGNETVENICIARKLDCIDEPVLQWVSWLQLEVRFAFFVASLRYQQWWRHRFRQWSKTKVEKCSIETSKASYYWPY